MTPIERLLLIRQGGAVERMHTIPHHGSYSVAEHSWGVAQIILCFVESPRPQLIRAALNHDVPEKWIGDLPAPFLWANPQIHELMRLKEAEVSNKLEIGYTLTSEEERWLSLADGLEFLLWTFDQVELGYAGAEKFVDRVRARFREKYKQGKLTTDMANVVAEILQRREKGWSLDTDLP